MFLILLLIVIRANNTCLLFRVYLFQDHLVLAKHYLQGQSRSKVDCLLFSHLVLNLQIAKKVGLQELMKFFLLPEEMYVFLYLLIQHIR